MSHLDDVPAGAFYRIAEDMQQETCEPWDALRVRQMLGALEANLAVGAAVEDHGPWAPMLVGYAATYGIHLRPHEHVHPDLCACLSCEWSRTQA